MDFDDQTLKDFLEPQIRDYGGNAKLEGELWALFAVSAHDALANGLARFLLTDVKFAHDSALSDDDQWKLYYVDTANRWAAVHWLDHLTKTLEGAIRPIAPANRELMDEVINSDKPHRAAHQLAELHTRGEISAGIFRESTAVRSLLDRLHSREPLFFSAFQTLLTHHLVDLVVLLKQMIPEDVALKNEIVKAGLSRDPFLQARQDAAAEIRNLLLRFQLINPIDQQKNIAITNPYAVYLDVIKDGDQITVPIAGSPITQPTQDFLRAIHVVRRNIYRGEQFSKFDTQAPWMSREIAYPFRFIKQQTDIHRELTTMDALYMLERAVEV